MITIIIIHIGIKIESKKEKNKAASQYSLVHKTVLWVKKTELTDYNENVSDIVVTVNGRSENNNVDHDESKEQILFHNDTAYPLRICEKWLPYVQVRYVYILVSFCHRYYISYIANARDWGRSYWYCSSMVFTSNLHLMPYEVVMVEIYVIIMKVNGKTKGINLTNELAIM